MMKSTMPIPVHIICEKKEKYEDLSNHVYCYQVAVLHKVQYWIPNSPKSYSACWGRLGKQIQESYSTRLQ